MGAEFRQDQDPCRRVARSIAAPGSHRSVRKSLDLYGSCHPGHQTAGTVFTQAPRPFHDRLA